MSCKICGSNACTSWMHSAEEQAEYDDIDGWDDLRLKREVVDLRRQVKELERQISIEGN